MGSQEFLECLDRVWLLYMLDAVDSVSGWGDAVLADCVAQEVESWFSNNVFVPVDHQIIFCQHLEIRLRSLACSSWLRDATRMLSTYANA